MNVVQCLIFGFGDKEKAECQSDQTISSEKPKTYFDSNQANEVSKGFCDEKGQKPVK